MRKLIFKDAMSLARIMKKCNLKTELNCIAEKFTGDNVNLEKAGVEIVMTVFEACGSEEVEKEVYTFLGSIFEKDIETMSLEAVVENFKQLAKENNLSSFFKSASL